MKLFIISIVVIGLLGLFPVRAKENVSTEKRILLISELISSNDYKSKIITMRLKLKCIDKIFEKITFYDAKNHDIEFDISSRKIKKKIAADMINIHEGLEYHVTFTIKNIGNLGQIIADLHSFKPVLLDTFPDSGIKAD